MHARSVRGGVARLVVHFALGLDEGRVSAQKSRIVDEERESRGSSDEAGA